jgi:hypothetical protein
LWQEHHNKYENHFGTRSEVLSLKQKTVDSTKATRSDGIRKLIISLKGKPCGQAGGTNGKETQKRIVDKIAIPESFNNTMTLNQFLKKNEDKCHLINRSQLRKAER